MTMWCPVHAVEHESNLCVECYAQKIEVPELRNRFEKHFKLPSGLMAADITRNRPTHYLEDEKWKDFAPVWGRTDKGWKLEGMPYGLSVHGKTLFLDRKDEFFKATLTEPAGLADPVVNGLRLFWESEGLTVYIKPHIGGIGFHYILHGPSSPRRFVWKFQGSSIWGEPTGRDNLEKSDARSGLDLTRLMDVSATYEDGLAVVKWSGRVKALDSNRVRHYSTDVIYPARVRH